MHIPSYAMKPRDECMIGVDGDGAPTTRLEDRLRMIFPSGRADTLKRQKSGQCLRLGAPTCVAAHQVRRIGMGGNSAGRELPSTTSSDGSTLLGILAIEDPIGSMGLGIRMPMLKHVLLLFIRRMGASCSVWRP